MQALLDLWNLQKGAMTDPMVQEWLTLLELTTNYMTAAEAVIEGLQGRVGHDVHTREEAMRETRRLVDAYTVAKVKLIEHARSREAMLS